MQGAPFGTYTNPGCRSYVALPWAVSFCLFEANYYRWIYRGNSLRSNRPVTER